jgi:hypothetical protein
MEKAEAQQRVALQSFGPERLQQLEELLRLLIDRQGTSEDVVDVSSVKSCHRAVGTGGERPLSALVDPAQEGCRGGAASVP